ncbi:MAG TPA: hypothetical protein GX728_00540 [Clostridiaceae bacterium]|jgi:Trk K+ transport system NAD-binding subunit|nr:hypothetical protein [Clostridiaceae bacterium]
MKRVATGAGMVGVVLYRKLCFEDHEITLIENTEKRLDGTIAIYDLMSHGRTAR